MGIFRSAEQRFGDQVTEAVRASGAAQAWLDEAAFAVRFRRTEGGAEGHINLHNTFRETRGLSKGERAEQVDRLVSAVLEDTHADATWDEIRPLLRPVLRNVTFGLGETGAATRLVSRPALPFLVELVVVDRPTSMAYVITDQLVDWGVSADEVFAAARASLAPAAARLLEAEPSSPGAVIRFVDAGDGYFTSMLLLDGFLAGLAPRVGGRPVAIVPDKDSLCVSADDPGLVGALLTMADADYREATRSISPVVYTVDDTGAVVPYAATEPGELANRVHHAQVLLAAGEYSAQKSVLEAEYERTGVDIFVGTPIVVSNPDNGTTFSVAVWAPEVDTLLPEADYVAFPDPMTMVPWSIVAARVGLRPEPGLAPARYRVTAWPDEAVLAELRADAVNP